MFWKIKQVARGHKMKQLDRNIEIQNSPDYISQTLQENVAILSGSGSTANLPSSACPLMMQRLHIAWSDAFWSWVVAAPLGCDNALLPQWSSRSCLARCDDPEAFPSHWGPLALKAVQEGGACGPINAPFADPAIAFCHCHHGRFDFLLYENGIKTIQPFREQFQTHCR